MNCKTHVEALVSCAAVCTECAGNCLAGDESLVPCMHLNLQCARLCETLVQFIALNSRYVKQLAALCAEVCHACARECSRHDNPYCRKSMNACMDCATICSGLVTTF